jgi:hypothetical protein
VDYFCGKALLPALCSTVSQVILIDHHKTALEDVEAMQHEDSLPKNCTIFLLSRNNQLNTKWI